MSTQDRTGEPGRADGRPSALAAWLRARTNAELERMCIEAGAKPFEGESSC
jgi:hypothetical protein